MENTAVTLHNIGQILVSRIARIQPLPLMAGTPVHCLPMPSPLSLGGYSSFIVFHGHVCGRFGKTPFLGALHIACFLWM